MTAEIFTVGKAEDNDLVIDDPHVSRHHCRFLRSGYLVLLEDLNSTNGTYVNGERVDRVCVTTADTVLLSGCFTIDWSNPQLRQWMGSQLSMQDNLKANSSHENVYDLNGYGKNAVTLGRSSTCDITLDNPRISRLHATATKDSDGYWVLKDSSTNGTFVDGVRITEKKLQPDSIVSLAGLPVQLSSAAASLQSDYMSTGDACIELQNVSFTVQDGNSRKTILRNISLNIRPGEFVGLIGPSGSGKTTLMLLMNGYNNPSSGRIRVNNIDLVKNRESFRGFMGYVPQDDIIHRELTVESSLMYNAKLRLPDLDDMECRRQVYKVISDLDLKEAKNVIVGTPEKKGISGGQRKRVNLAQELITEPSVLFLDEPCSGLDPKSENDVMKMLQSLSRRGKTTLITTHGITERNFSILDKLIVIGKGGILAYYGPATDATKYFGVESPEDIFEALEKTGADAWNEHYCNSQYYHHSIQSDTNGDTSELTVPKPKQHGKLRQLFLLCQRYAEIKWRDKMLTAILMAQAPFIGLIILMATSSNTTQHSTWCFLLVISALWLGVSNAAREIVSERAIFKRESKVFLDVKTYLASKFIVLAIFEAVQCLMLLAISYKACNLGASFVSIYLVLILISISATALGLLVSSYSSTEAQAMALVPLFLIPQVILGGALIGLDGFLRVPAAAMLSRWGWEALFLMELEAGKLGGVASIANDPLLRDGNIPVDYLMIVVWMIVYAYLSKKRLEKG